MRSRVSKRNLPYLTLILLLITGLLKSSTVSLNFANSATDVLLLISLAAAWNIVAGFGGQFSLGHSILIGLGGYGTAIFLVHSGLSVYADLVIASLIAAVIGVIFAYPMIRLRGPYFSIGTLGLTLATLGWMLNWTYTNRSQAYSLPADKSPDIPMVFSISLAIAVLTLIISIAIRRSALGLRFISLKENEEGAVSLGVNRTATILPVWAISAFLTGLTGAGLALQKGTLDPGSALSLQFTMDAIVVCVVGGLGTLTGPVVGAIFVYEMRQQLVSFDALGTFLEAVVVLVFLRFAPNGLVDIAKTSFLNTTIRLRNQ
jgi:branched-chain amino acid transport system permease protein